MTHTINGKCGKCGGGKDTPLGELVEAIQVFRNKMAQDRCHGHCKTYQEEIQKLSDIANQITNA